MKYLSKVAKIELFERGLKICTRCKDIKPLDEFHNNATRPDGKTDWCKVCASEYKSRPETLAMQRRRKASPKGQAWQRNYWTTDAYKESQRRYRQSKKGKRAAEKHTSRYKGRYPERIIAKDAVNNAVRDGKLPPIQEQKCQHCDSCADHYHHWSYLPEHRLDVIPLCKDCHIALHNRLNV